MASDYAQQLGSRLRSIRQQQGLSLHGVEEKSNGRWKAVVVGSYERGDRAVTVPKLADLAEFYGVPLAELLPSSRGSASALEAVPKVTIDLNKLGELDQPEAAALGRYAASIQSVRGDYNGKVLSIRKEDLRTLAVIYDEPMEQLTERFIEWGVLNVDARGVARDDR
jgi:transcriptional regulator with XRE-family HTH domain